MPFTRDEFTRILAACDKYPDKLNAVRLRALVFLLCYSGLRITDAVTVRRDRITDGKLFLYTAKTGTAVYCPLPPFLLTALEVVPTVSEHFFWTGTSKPKSAVGDWQRALKRLFTLAWYQPATLIDFGILLRLSCCLRVSRWSACLFS